MKQRIPAIMIISMLLLIPLAYAETDSVVDEKDFEGALNDNTSLEVLLALALGEETPQTTEESQEVLELEERPRGLQMALLRLRYAFTFNSERKAEVGLEIAQARLSEAHERLQERNMERSENALEEYQRAMERVRNNLENVQAERANQEKLLEIQKRIELQRAVAVRMQNSISEDDELSEEETEGVRERIRTANEVSENARNAALERREIRDRNEDDEVSSARVEREATERILGEKQSAEVMIRGSVYAYERVQSVINRFSQTTEDEEALSFVREQHMEIRALISEAREQYVLGNYRRAKDVAQEARLRSSRLFSHIMSQAQSQGNGTAQAVRDAVREPVRMIEREERTQQGIRFVQDRTDSSIIYVYSNGALRERVRVDPQIPIAEQIARQLNIALERVRMNLELNERIPQSVRETVSDGLDETVERVEERVRVVEERIRPVEERPVEEETEATINREDETNTTSDMEATRT